MHECMTKKIKFNPLKPTATVMLNLVWTWANDFSDMKYMTPRANEYCRGMWGLAGCCGI